MKKQKSLSQVWQPSLSCFLLFAFSGCFPIKHSLSTVQYQKAMDLVDQGTLMLRIDKLDEAQGAFAAAAEISSIAAAIDGLGCVAFKHGNFNLAEQYFVQAYEMDSRYTSSLGNLALLYDVNGLSDKAKQLYQMALASEPENFRTRNNFAVYLFEKQDLENVKLELHKSLALAKHPVVTANLRRLEEYE